MSHGCQKDRSADCILSLTSKQKSGKSVLCAIVYRLAVQRKSKPLCNRTLEEFSFLNIQCIILKYSYLNAKLNTELNAKLNTKKTNPFEIPSSVPLSFIFSILYSNSYLTAKFNTEMNAKLNTKKTNPFGVPFSVP